MKPRLEMALIGLAGAVAGALAMYAATQYRGTDAMTDTLATHRVPAPKHGGTVVELCDGVTSMEVKNLKPGDPMTHQQAVAVTRQLMAKWQRKHPNAHWQMAANDAGTAPSQHGGEAASQGAATQSPAGLTIQQGDTYASFTDRDYKIWKAQTDAFVAMGDKVFHSSKLLGSTIGVSCDMCHPNAANTHPETYPKYQVQLQRVALLRDMIDWCIENPVKGKTLSPNDPKMRALEAYILAQRKGAALDYGKH